MIRRTSKPLRIGKVTVGGDAPIAVQSMTKTDTRDVHATIAQIKELEDCGCDIVRVAVPDREAAESLMGDKEQIARVVVAAKEREVPIRIGVNAGSLPADFQPRAPLAERMVSMALLQIKLMEDLDFDLIKVSLKAFDVPTTVQAYQTIADRMPYPLHLGVTEAGLPRAGAIRSAIGIGVLLHLGIGDTVRVSLTAHPREEAFVAYEILKSLGLRQRGPTLVSCPSCGRAEVDIMALAEAVNQRLASISEPIKVAVMGCVVNGPGEAEDADVGIAGGKGKGAIFRKGKVVGTVGEDKFLAAIMAELDSLIKKGTEQR